MHTLLCCLPCSSLYCINIIVLMNPCPCGFYPDRNRCSCTSAQVKNYLSRISGPILDRIDICVEAPRMEVKELNQEQRGESSAAMRERIISARDMQKERYKGTNYSFNSDLGPAEISKYCLLGRKERHFMEKAFDSMQLSARAYHRILKVARTIADLDGKEKMEEIHLAQALCYRSLDRKYWEG